METPRSMGALTGVRSSSDMKRAVRDAIMLFCGTVERGGGIDCMF
jgi:hypothetical protein